MINAVRVYLEDNCGDYSDGTIQCGFMVSEDESGQEQIHQGLVDNAGYRSLRELVREIAAIFEVSTEMIVVD